MRDIPDGRSPEIQTVITSYSIHYTKLYELKKHGFTVDRMKTGTSARVDGRSINFDAMAEQKGDMEGRCFSYSHDKVDIRDEKSCYITYTNQRNNFV